MKRFVNTKTIAGLGMLLAMVIALQLLSNYVQFGPVSITLALFPIAVGAMLFGPVGGFFLGLIDGAMVLLAPSTAGFLAHAPVATVFVCLLKTGLAGLGAGFLFKLFQKKNYKVGIVLASLSVPIINTGLFAVAALIFFKELLLASAPESGKTAVYILFIFWIGWNFFLEFGLNAAIAPAMFTSYRYIEMKVTGENNMKKTSYYDDLTKSYEQDLFENIKKFVAIPSVYSDETKDKNNPFGVEVSKALQFIAEVAKKDGFKVTNYDNMVVEIIAGDETKKNVTIMAHADVVPVGAGWDQDPFEVVEKKGVLYGRGVADDKGPLLSCYYGMKALRDNNLIDGYHVRFLVGGNEESGSLGMIHYFEELKKYQPDLGFSPDSAYPLTYGEKGIIGFKAAQKVNFPQVFSIDGGVAHNAVIEQCDVKMIKDEAFIKYLNQQKVKYQLKELEDRYVVSFFGAAAHGSVPWMGVNAGLIALDKLASFYKNEELLHAYKCFSETRGAGVKADAHNEEMGDNSLCVGFVKLHNGELEITINFRYINGVTEEEMINAFKTNAAPMEIEVQGTSPLLYFPRDSVLITTLMHAYQEETGDYESQPMTSGGGTYAKEANNVVAFGMQLPGWDSKMHAIGEQVERSNLIKSMAIYARAIEELGQKLK